MTPPDRNLRDTKPPYVWALVTFVVIFGIYGVTLSPTTAFWDTSEYIAAAKVLGIPHPPGNPLFTLMAHVWGFLPLAASYAKRINFFAAATSAGGAALWFLVTERWLRPLLPAAWPRRAAAFAGVFAAATAWTVWNQSTVNEKVYTVSLLSIALIAWCVVRWADQPPEARRDRYLVAAVYLLALTSTNHLMGVLVAPLAAVYVLFTDWRVILRPRLVATIVIVALIGVSLNYLYLPIRAAQYPPINEGEPVCRSLLQAITLHCQPLQDVLNRVQYAKPPVTQRMSPFGAQLAMYWRYLELAVGPRPRFGRRAGHRSLLRVLAGRTVGADQGQPPRRLGGGGDAADADAAADLLSQFPVRILVSRRRHLHYPRHAGGARARLLLRGVVRVCRRADRRRIRRRNARHP